MEVDLLEGVTIGDKCGAQPVVPPEGWSLYRGMVPLQRDGPSEVFYCTPYY